MRPKIFITKKIPKEAETFIAKHCDYKIWDKNMQIPREELIKELKEIDGLLTSGIKIDEDLLKHAPNLKVVSNISVGYDNFDIDAMKKRNIIGTHTPHVLDETVADLVMGLMLSTSRRIVELDRYVKEGKWLPKEDSELFGVDVHHSTLGLIGLGRIGEAIARRAKLGFNMNVNYYSKHEKPEIEEKLGINYMPHEEILATSDFVVVMVRLTPETHHLIGEKEFALMKKNAILINASRGETVDESALVEALKEGKLRGAGLDVYHQEPISKEHPLLQFPNVVTLPHIGSATARTRFDMAMHASENIVEALQGKTAPSIVPELR